MKDGYQRIPQCGWPCRLSNEDPNTIDLNDGTSVKLEGDFYVWYDIEGGVQDRFERGSIDFESWNEVHTALRGCAPVG